MPPDHKSSTAKSARPILCLALLAGLSHLPSLTGGLVWDDVEIVAQRPVVRSIGAAVRQLAAFRPWQPHEVGKPRPRPLRDLLLAICHTVWGRRPFGYHLSNWVLHGAVAYLAFLVLSRLGLGRRSAFLGAALFACHPAVAETVAQIKNRGDLAAALFCLLSLLAALAARGPAVACFVSLLLYCPALLCAEWPVVVPVVFMLAMWIFGQRKAGVLVLLPHLALASAFAYWAGRASSGGGSTFGESLAAVGRNLLGYTAMGSALGCLSPMPRVDVTIGATAFAVLCATAAACVLARPPARRPVLVGLAWTLVAVAPFCLITPELSDRTVATHRLYFACVGVGVLAAGIFARGTAIRLLVLVCWASLSTQQHFVWASSRELWSRDRVDRSEASEGRLGLANWYVDHGRCQAAARELRSALAHGPVTADLLGNLGQVYLEQGHSQGALAVLLKAAQLGETAETANALGIAHERLGKRDDAIAAYQRAIALDPANADAYHNLGNCYSQMGDAAEAGKCYRAAIRIDPGAVLSHMALGRVCYHSGDLDRAEAHFKAAARGPTYADAHIMLGLVATTQGDFPAAERHRRAAATHLGIPTLEPQGNAFASVPYLLLVAEIAESKGDIVVALTAYRQVLKLRPEEATIRERVTELGNALEPANQSGNAP